MLEAHSVQPRLGWAGREEAGWQGNLVMVLSCALLRLAPASVGRLGNLSLTATDSVPAGSLHCSEGLVCLQAGRTGGKREVVLAFVSDGVGYYCFFFVMLC